MRSRMAGISAALVVVLAMPVVGSAPVLADPGARGLQAGTLTVEHQEDPLGVDVTKPRLGWVLDSDRPGARQSAYEVQVSSAPGRAGDVWDSGRVSSAKSFDVEYAGARLQPRTRYSWRVRVWDADRRASAWSEPAWFETAFLDGKDFQGDWIGARADAGRHLAARRELDLVPPGQSGGLRAGRHPVLPADDRPARRRPGHGGPLPADR